MRNRILKEPVYLLGSLAALSVLAVAGWLVYSAVAPGQRDSAVIAGVTLAQTPTVSSEAALPVIDQPEATPTAAESPLAMSSATDAEAETTVATTETTVATVGTAAAAETPVAAAAQGASGTGAVPPKATVGDTVTSNGVTATLSDAQPFSWGPGIQLEFELRNDSAKDLHFFFSPKSSFQAHDGRGNVYALQWAEYSGEVKMARGEQVKLVKAFFAPAANASDVGYNRKEGAYEDGSYIVVTMSRVGPFESASWSVPLTMPTNK